MTPTDLAAANTTLIIALTAAIYKPIENAADFLEAVTNELSNLAPALPGEAREATEATVAFLMASEPR
ncbi:hypothetical protein [Rhizobiales bacterium]|uniref:hypothetical protein n=1 Tax=Agrobacterium sp. M50-1 TaxID=3132821 RepID=UPI000DD75AD1